ncbi:MAG: DUF444 family protein [Candidatus Spechtbacteria bacterium]|nr:DUF444 family protein [Candidatus Spechtbacteria bacterium]
MALRVISIAQSPDPLAYEREDHRARALVGIFANASRLMEINEVGLTRILTGGIISLKVPALPESRLLFVDHAGDEWSYEAEEYSDLVMESQEQVQGSGEFAGGNDERGEMPQSPSSNKKKPSRFGEQSSGVGQSKTARRGEELGRVPITEAGQESEKMDFPHWPDDEMDPEFTDGAQGAGVNPEGVAFEENVRIEQLLDAIAEQFHLPLLRTTNLGALRVRTKGRPYGVRMRGPQAQLHKRKTSEKRMERIGDGDDDFSEEDLRYIRHESREEYKSNAVVIFVRDASHSTRKEEILNLIRVFCMHLLRAIRMEHDRVDLVFITFDREAKRHAGEKAEWEFFHRFANGGTIISSGLNMALNILEKEYSGIEWNKFVFILSDGEKQEEEDKNPAILSEAIARLALVTDIMGYFEVGHIGPNYSDYDPFMGRAASSLVCVDGDGTIRDPKTKSPTGSFTAIKEFLDVASRGQGNIVAARFGDHEGAGKAFTLLIEFCEKRRSGNEQ